MGHEGVAGFVRAWPDKIFIVIEVTAEFWMPAQYKRSNSLQALTCIY